MSKFEVVPLYESNYRDPASTLRVIADEIEAGGYGEVLECTLIMKADSLEIFGMGRNSDAGTTCLHLAAAMQKLVAPIVG